MAQQKIKSIISDFFLKDSSASHKQSQQESTISVDTHPDWIIKPGHRFICGPSADRMDNIHTEVLQALENKESFILSTSNRTYSLAFANMAREQGYTIARYDMSPYTSTDKQGVDYIKALKSMDSATRERVSFELATAIYENALHRILDNILASSLFSSIRNHLRIKYLQAAILYATEIDTNELSLADAIFILLDNPCDKLMEIFSGLDALSLAKNTLMMSTDFLLLIPSELDFLRDFLQLFMIFREESISRLTAAGAEIAPTLPGKQKCAYFLDLPAKFSSTNMSADIFSALFMQILLGSLETPGVGKHFVPVNFILDDIVSLGYLTSLEKYMRMPSKASFSIYADSIDPILALYPHTWRYILDCCDTQILMGSGDITPITRNYYQKLIESANSPNIGRRYIRNIQDDPGLCLIHRRDCEPTACPISGLNSF